MARCNNASPRCRDWTTAKLLDELERKANMSMMGVDFTRDQIDAMNAAPRSHEVHSDAIREATRLYRATWVQPLIDELRRRMVKPRK